MTRPARKIDIVSMTSATNLSRHAMDETIKAAMNLDGDPEREKRRVAHLCRWCFYRGPRIGGAAMTSQPCGLCGKVQHFGSTATDDLCDGCAKEHDLCKRCGGDGELRLLRRKWPKAKVDMRICHTCGVSFDATGNVHGTTCASCWVKA